MELLAELQKARDAGLPVAIHFAELENADEAAQILKFAPERLGHAVCMSEATKELLLRTSIPVEICLTSNIKTLSVESVDAHVLSDLLQHRHPCALCVEYTTPFM